MVFGRTICSRVADLGPIGGFARGTHRALSGVCERRPKSRGVCRVAVGGSVHIRSVRAPQRQPGGNARSSLPVPTQGLGIRAAETHHRRTRPVQSARFLPVSRLRARIATRNSSSVNAGLAALPESPREGFALSYVPRHVGRRAFLGKAGQRLDVTVTVCTCVPFLPRLSVTFRRIAYEPGAV